MKKTGVLIVLVFLILNVSGVFAANRIIPHEDLIYQGAFKPPMNGMSYVYTKQSGFGWDQEHNTLLIIGKTNTFPILVEGIVPPNIVLSRNPDDLNLASVYSGQSGTDITGGRQVDGVDTAREVLSDILYLPQQINQASSKIYWQNWWSYSVTSPIDPRFGWSNLDFGNTLDSDGKWGLDGIASRIYDKWLVAINSDWADLYVGSKYLAHGRQKTGGSWGPSLYASAPWTYGSSPADGTAMESVELMNYPPEHSMEVYSRGSTANDAIWLTIGTKQAYVVLSTMSFRLSDDDGQSGAPWGFYGHITYHNEGSPDSLYGCGSDYESHPHIPMLFFYDVDEIAEIAQGTRESWNIQPYAYHTLDEYFFRSSANLETCALDITLGLAFDSATNNLYVGEAAGYYNGPYELLPIIHAFNLQDVGSELDIAPPTSPGQTDMVGPEISWDASTDDQDDEGIIYVIYRDFDGEFVPIQTTRDTNWVDTEPEGGPHLFRVEAYDQSMNLGNNPASTGAVITGFTISGGGSYTP